MCNTLKIVLKNSFRLNRIVRINQLPMEPFEYVVVLFSLILGLGIAQLLTGIADIVSNLKNTKTTLAHSVMVFNVFLLHIQEWWYSYQYASDVKVWTLPLVLFLLVYPILLFLLARMLFPTGLRGHETNLEEYYYDQWKWFFGITLSIIVVSFLQNIIVSGWAITSQIPQYLMALAYIAFLTLDIQNKKAHNIFVILQGLAWLIWAIVDPYELK